MTRLSTVIAVSTALLMGVMTTSAMANCERLISKAEAGLAGMSSDHANYKKIQNMIKKSQAALADGKKKKCSTIAKKANNLAAKSSSGGGAKKSASGGDVSACKAAVEDAKTRMGGVGTRGQLSQTVNKKIAALEKQIAAGNQKKCEKLAKGLDKFLSSRNK